MLWLKQSTSVNVMIGPFVDETDGKTAETGLTIAQADVRLSMNGGNMAQKTEASNCTHDEIGVYSCPLDTTDTGTLGRLQLFVHESGALPVWHEFMVAPANVWDSMFGADMLKVDVHAVDDDEAAADNLESACDNYSVTRGLTGTALPAAAADAAGGLPISDAGGLDLDTQIGTDIDAILTDTGELQTDWVNGGRLDLLIDAILADTGELQTDWVNGGRLDLLIDAILADTGELQTDWVNGGRLDLLIDAVLADTAELQGDWVNGGRLDLLIDAITVHLTDVKGGTFNGATDSLEAIRDRGDAAWTTGGGGGGGDATAANQTTIIDHLTDVKGTGFVKDTDSLVDLGHIGADGDTLETLSDQIDGVGGQAGSGAITFTYTLTSSVDSSPVADADVWVTSDQAGSNVLASGTTDSNGQVVFYLDAGTVYVWRQKSGWNFTNPDTETVA